MNTYTVLPKPANLDWSEIPFVQIATPYRNSPADISATGQLCYDSEALYVRLTAKEAYIRAVYTEPLDPPCEDSCLEFFFSPIEGDLRYFNIEFNPNCCMYLGIASSIKDLVRLIPEIPSGENPLNPVVTYTEDGWEIVYSIPYSFIRRFFPGFEPAPGKTIRGNFYKCGELTKVEHYYSWSPITGDVLSFHRPNDFGYLTFK